MADDMPAEWGQRVYKGMQQKATLLGVPYIPGALLALGTLLVLWWYWPLLPLPLIAWGIAAAVTTYDALFLLKLWRHIRYSAFYRP